jgi:hypothetical protein
MTTEMWLLDQLGGGDMPMPLLVSHFGSVERAQRAILAFHSEQVIEVLDAEMSPLPVWRVADLCRMTEGEWELTIAPFRLRMTKAGWTKYRL